MNVHRHDYVQNKCKIKKVNAQNTWCNSASNANTMLLLLTCQQNVYFKTPHIYFYLQLSIR